MSRTLAILFTLTTYGTWLRGDARGWVDRGQTLPPDPLLEAADRSRMKHPPFMFSRDDLMAVGDCLGCALGERLGLRIFAMAVRVWHVHFVATAGEHAASSVVKCVKDAVRWRLRVGRPIWSDGYDKRFCFDERSVRARVQYVERHNLELGWPARPWDFIEPLDVI
jgi:hypothetical protein